MFGIADVENCPVTCTLRLFLTHAHTSMPIIPASPATAEPVAMPIVRPLMLGDELSLPESVVAVDEGPDATDTDAEASGVLSVTKPLLVADGVAAVSVEVAVASPSLLLACMTQSAALLQEYPNGQHCEPQVGSCPVKFVVWTGDRGLADAS